MSFTYRFPLLLALITALGFILRLYHFTNPVADWHSFRQADTASVAREYTRNGIDLLRPRYHDLSNIQSGQDNPEGYRMVEFPIISAFVAASYPLVSGFWAIHLWYRFITICFSLLSLILLTLIATRLFSQVIGLLSGFIFAVLPYSIYYSRAILPETPLVTLALLSIYASLLFSRHPKYIYLITIFISSSLALLLKPTAIFLLLPSLVFFLPLSKSRLRSTTLFLLAGLLSFLPLFLWRWWITRFPEGIAAFFWLLDGSQIRLKPAFFRWLFYERLSQLVLGSFGLLFFGLGLINFPSDSHTTLKQKLKSILNPSKLTPSFHSYLYLIVLSLTLLLYLVIFATGNVQHDYYQIILLPLICISVAKGIYFLWDLSGTSPKVLTAIFLVFMLAFSWFEVSGYYQVNNWAIVKAGKYVAHHTSADSLVIAPYMGDTAFLYQTERRGWPLGHEIDEKIAAGADYYVSTSYDDEARLLARKYLVVHKTDDFILIDLNSHP